MPTKKNDPYHDIDINLLKKRIIYSGDDPVNVGYAASDAEEDELKWLVYESTFVGGDETERNFAQNANGDEDNGFIHAWVAIKQVTEIRIKKALVVGNILSVKVDGSSAITQAFTVDSDTTLAAWGILIAIEAGIDSALVRDSGGDGSRDGALIVTAEVAGTAFVLTELGISGGLQIPQIEQVTVKPNQVAAASKTYGV